MSASPHSQDDLHGATDLIGQRLGRYEILCQLAAGGMGGVYAARAQGLAGFERLVAVKVLHPHLAHEDEFISMFLDEARLAARIRHPNVVATLDISDSETAGYFLVMDYVEGDHLGGLLQRAASEGKRLPLPTTTRIISDALAGLDAAHGLTDDYGRPLNLVHRDVSPHNILVGRDGIARLTDFGVAKAEVRLSSTREGQFKGKLSYMSPEQASTGEADQRSDLFSMGIILWETLCGVRLFRADNNAATLNRIIHWEVPAPSSRLPELAPFDDVTLKALAKDPADRFQSAEEFARALEHAAQDAGHIGTSRMVADAVNAFAATKLADDALRIRGAIERLGPVDLSEHTPTPRGDAARRSAAVGGAAGAEGQASEGRIARGAGEVTRQTRRQNVSATRPAKPMSKQEAEALLRQVAAAPTTAAMAAMDAAPIDAPKVIPAEASSTGTSLPAISPERRKAPVAAVLMIVIGGLLGTGVFHLIEPKQDAPRTTGQSVNAVTRDEPKEPLSEPGHERGTKGAALVDSDAGAMMDWPKPTAPPAEEDSSDTPAQPSSTSAQPSTGGPPSSVSTRPATKVTRRQAPSRRTDKSPTPRASASDQEPQRTSDAELATQGARPRARQENHSASSDRAQRPSADTPELLSNPYLD